MEPTEHRKPHAVLVPWPGQGHINPIMQLAKLLHARGFHITFVITEFIHNRLIITKGPDSVKGLPDFRFETIPDGLPPSDSRQDIAAISNSLEKHCLAPFRELVIKLNSSPDVPPVSCIISDGVFTIVMSVAKELGIPEAQFWTASACGLMGYFQYAELVKSGLVPLKDSSYLSNGYLNTPLDWIPGMKAMRLRDMPTFCHTTDPNDFMVDLLIRQVKDCRNSSAIIINTFYEFEKKVLDALASNFPTIYTIGPLAELIRNLPNNQLNSVNTSIWQENTECIDWLDKKEPSSVVYVNFGSIAIMTEQQMKEFALGLMDCGFNFLWVSRSDGVKGDKVKLTERIMEETRERGLVVSWCPQEKVLKHSSVGLFITHAGWNSLMESVMAGKPLLCWPVLAEQTTNCRQVCNEWGTGMEVEREAKSGEIVKLVREMMVGEIGIEKKEKTLEWKKKVEEATSDGGSSYINFDKIFKEVLFRKK